jgi:photosystem II stability/assembly factor-like uncharacterized protein
MCVMNRRQYRRTVGKLVIFTLLFVSIGSANLGPAAAEPPAAHFYVVPEDIQSPVYGHEWTPGAMVTVTVDGTEFEATAEAFTAWDQHDWLGPGDFDLGPVDFDFQPGHTVRVTSNDDPPVQKAHTVTALQVTEVNPVGDTVAGTTYSEPGSIVVVVIHYEPVRRLVEVQADGSWLADFATAVDDGGEGWGEPFDIRTGTGGHASEFDADGDATSINWLVPDAHEPNPHFTVGPIDSLWRDAHPHHVNGWEWPAEVVVTVATDVPGSPAQTVHTSTDGEFHLDLIEVWDPIVAGDVITVTYTPDNGAAVVKTLTVSSLTVTDVDVDASTVSGTADYGHATNLDEVVVAVYGEHDWIAARHVDVQPDGTWTANFSSPPAPDAGWDVATFDAHTHGDVFQHNHTGDATFAGWAAPEVYQPTFGYQRDWMLIQSGGWPAGVPVTVTTSAEGNPEQTVMTGAEDSDWPGFIRLSLLDVWEPVEPGEEITLTHVPDVGPAIVKTLTVSSLTVTSVDVDASTVSGVADYGHASNLDEVQVIVYDHDNEPVAWRLVDVASDGTWTADFSSLPDPDRGEGLVTFEPPYPGGEVVQHNRTGDSTYIRWGIGPPATALVSATAEAVDPATFGAVGDTLTLTFNDALNPDTSPRDPVIEFASAAELQCRAGDVTCTIADDTLTVTVSRTHSQPRNLDGEHIIAVTDLEDAHQRPVVVHEPVAIVGEARPPTRLTAALAETLDASRFGLYPDGDTFTLSFDAPVQASQRAPIIEFQTASALDCQSPRIDCTVEGQTLTLVTEPSANPILSDLRDEHVTAVQHVHDSHLQPIAVPQPVPVDIVALTATRLESVTAEAVDPTAFGAVGDTLGLTFNDALDPDTSPRDPVIEFASAAALACRAGDVTCTIADDTLTVTVTRTHSQARNLDGEHITAILGLSDASQRPVVVYEPVAITLPMSEPSWTPQSSGTTQHLFAVHFVDASRGWGVGTGGTILSTTNGGATWTPQRSGTTVWLHGVHFVDANRGWAVGAAGTILATTNGGASWIRRTSGTTAFLFSVHFVDANRGWTTGQAGTILATTNGGARWTSQTNLPPGNPTLRDVHFVNANRGWAVGSNGTILATTNGGASWIRRTSGTATLHGASFVDANRAWVVGSDGLIASTTDGWATSVIRQTSGTTQHLYGVHFVDVNRGWAVGAGGTILATTNGGSTWTPQSSNTTALQRSVHFVDATRGWAVGDLGTILTYR